MKTTSLIFIAFLSSLAFSCTSSKNVEPVRTDSMDSSVSSAGSDLEIVEAPSPAPIGGKKLAMPRAVIYKTNGNYNDNVKVVLNSRYNTLVYYPATTDVNSDASPMVLADGWLLDRQGGLSMNTAFLKWTYSQYHSLPQTPSPKELIENLLPDAKVTQMITLDMTNTAAQNDTAYVNQLIRSGQIRIQENTVGQ